MQEVTEGDMAVFTCSLSKAGQTVSWYKDGQRIAGNRCTISCDGNLHKLTIPECAMKDTGGYTMKVGHIESSGDLIVNGETWLEMKAVI